MSFYKMEKDVYKTNLVSHQALLKWYEEITALQAREVILCMLMLRVPGEWKLPITACDIPKTRHGYLESYPTCFCGTLCLPRIEHAEESGHELAAYYRSRY